MYKKTSRSNLSWFFLFFCLPLFLNAKSISTFYGSIEVEEPVLLELIDSPAFQRLQFIHQYGIAYYISHKEEYNRYDHSLGVFTILRLKGASLEEQIAGLLHDVSHTAFSHVGDWVYGKENQEKDYQSSIHSSFLILSGLEQILNKYHITIDQILPTEELFPALECALPSLCADRIDYNIQGAYYQGFITHEEAMEILNSLHFTEGRWISPNKELMKKLARFSLFMTMHCWGSPKNYLTSRWLADAILRGIELKKISYEELHFGTDQMIWDKLLQDTDLIIQEKMKKIQQAESYFIITESSIADDVIKNKFRGIDPFIEIDSAHTRLTQLDANFAKEYNHVKEIMSKGWPIKLITE